MPEKKKEVEAVVHNLFTREIRPIRNWYEWLERWQEAITLEEMLGLLHVGFTVSLERGQWGEKEYDEIDRIIFYFTIADGWGDHYLLEHPTDNRATYRFGKNDEGRPANLSLAQLRQVVANKAFELLCSHFFKRELMDWGHERKEFAYHWQATVASERLFPTILGFFRIEPERLGNNITVRNLHKRWPLERSHGEQHMVNFLVNLTEFMWRWKEAKISSWAEQKKQDQEAKQNLEMRTRLDSAKPWMIEVLGNINELKVLREWMLDLDQSCLAKLKEIALRNTFDYSRHPVIKPRKVANIDEACFVGSPAGWFLKEHELKKREHKRLTAILEAENQKRDIDKKIEKLTTKK